MSAAPGRGAGDHRGCGRRAPRRLRPFNADIAGEGARNAFALGTGVPTLPEWIPRTAAARRCSSASRRASRTSSRASGEGAFAPAVDALNQLRLIAAIGLGVNVDRDLLPLFDGEVALALRGIGEDGPLGQVLLRPADADAARAALDRMRSALADRGSSVTTSEVAGIALTSVEVPQIGTVAYAVNDGVIVLGVDRATSPRRWRRTRRMRRWPATSGIGPHSSSSASTPATNSGPMCRSSRIRWPASSTPEPKFAISSTRSASLQSAQPPTTIGWRSMAC